MGIHEYKTWNVPMVTAAAPTPVATGTSLKTMLQLATPSTRMVRLISWGFQLDALPASGSGVVELLETDVAATVTAHVASGVQPLYPGIPASLLTLGTSATGYTATVEGSVTTTRSFDTNKVSSTAGADSIDYVYQWMPDERPWVNISKFLRVRATFAASVNLLCFVCHEE
jgi:hypothetical protein